MVEPSVIVREARRDIGLTQSELAVRAGTSQSAISAIERGARVPSTELLARILRAAELRPSVPLELARDDVLAVAERLGLSNVRVFGSTVRGEDGPESDVDLLVHLEPGANVLDAFAFPSYATEIIGFPVDMLLDDSIGSIVEQAKKEAVPL